MIKLGVRNLIMSKISEQLLKYAQDEKQAHEGYIRDFSATAIACLIQGGVAREKAILLTKEACLRNTELSQSIARFNILEKTAQYIEAVEEENIKLAAKLATQAPEQKPVEMPEHLKKLAALGFTQEEIDAMKSVPDKILEKMARTAETADSYELGRGVGPKIDKMDPLLEFLLS
jgi:hypothetical protein